MGIIRSDTIDTSYGDSISNCYMAIADQSIEIRREQDEPDSNNREGETQEAPSTPHFTVTFSAKLWLSQSARTAGKSVIKHTSYRTTYETLPSDKTIYDIAYEHIKSTLTEGTYTDA